jgi:serine/threonine protein kinase
MVDDSPPASPAQDSPPSRTTGGNFRWEPPTAEELQALMPGYTIEKLLGRGGMGAVYRGVQTNLDRPVAIKILPPGVEREDPSFAERFRSEARLMAKLMHPGIVAVFDFGTTLAGQLYFAMEYVDGSDVSQMIAAQKKLPQEHALAIIAHMCDALGAAHKLGIVHRDIKPANVLINREGQVKIADFGLAKIEDPGSHGLTKTGYAMGTPDFVAPEALMLGTQIDGRADIYALGVMLYQMLTGQIPRGAWEPASVITPGTDIRFDHIITKSMQYDRERRYQSSAELRHDLDVILSIPLVRQDAPAPAVVPADQVAQMPGQRSAVQKPVGKAPQPKNTSATPSHQAAAPAGASAHGASQSPKPNATLYTIIGIAAVIAISAWVMFSGGKKPPAKSAAAESPSGGAAAKQGSPAPPKSASLPATKPSSSLRFSPSSEPWVDALADPAALKLTGSASRTAEGLEFGPGTHRVNFPGLTGPDYAIRVIAQVNDRRVPTYLYLRHTSLGYSVICNIGNNPGNPNNVSISQYVGGKFANLKKFAFNRTFQEGDTYELEARIVGGKMTVAFDGVTLGSVEDSTFASGGPSIDAGGPFHAVQYLDLSKPASDAFMREVAALPTKEQQTARVASEVQKLNPAHDGRLDFKKNQEGFFAVLLRTENISDIAPLRALPWMEALSLSTKAGNIPGKLKDLSPLRGLKLVQFTCSQNPVTDLAPLVGMPLKDLQIYKAGSADCTVLRGMKLQSLICIGDSSFDLSVLEGMPLKKLSFTAPKSGMLRPGDLAILRSITTLETINAKPAAEFLKQAAPPESGSAMAPISASPQQFLSGQRTLFDGQTFSGWHGLGQKTAPTSWHVEEATMTGGGKTVLVTNEAFDDFDLSLEWRMGPQGNGGIVFLMPEIENSRTFDPRWPEFSLMDDSTSPNNKSGSLYGVQETTSTTAVKPVGSWNSSRLVKRGGKVEHWINEQLVCSYDLNDPPTRELWKSTNIGRNPGFASGSRGRIGLQGWIGETAYRNVMLRSPLAGAISPAPVPQTITIPELATLHEQFIKLQAERVTAVFAADVTKLNAGYVGGIDRKIAEEKAAGHLEGILALEAEKKLVAGRQLIPAEDDDKTTASLKSLRTIYREAYAKLEAARAANLKVLIDPLTVRLQQLETDLTKLDRINDAKTVREYRETLAESSRSHQAVIAPQSAGGLRSGAALNPATILAAKDGFTNTLGIHG